MARSVSVSHSFPREGRPLAAPVRWALAGLGVVLLAGALGVAVTPPPLPASDVAVTDWRGNSGRLAPAE